MFSSKQQQEIFTERFGNIQLYLKQYCLKPNEESLHKLRVEIKKLRAISRFIDDTTKSNKTVNILQPVISIFKKAAQIRSIHIHMKLTHKLSGKKFRTEQLKLQKQKEALFVSKQARFTKQLRKAGSKLPLKTENIKNKAIEKWFRLNLKKAYSRLKEGEHKFHSGRKIIKRLLYVNDAIAFTPGINKLYLKQVEELLGNWNDLTESNAFIEKEYPVEKKTMALLDKKSRQSTSAIKALIANFKTRAIAKK
ncbi:MAG TPA: CHAD domain-containing protein [Chitinophagales bacterium]|nr:CHAD domain-containing protein [Chitinophagales bacterium]